MASVSSAEPSSPNDGVNSSARPKFSSLSLSSVYKRPETKTDKSLNDARVLVLGRGRGKGPTSPSTRLGTPDISTLPSLQKAKIGNDQTKEIVSTSGKGWRPHHPTLLTKPVVPAPLLGSVLTPASTESRVPSLLEQSVGAAAFIPVDLQRIPGTGSQASVSTSPSLVRVNPPQRNPVNILNEGSWGESALMDFSQPVVFEEGTGLKLSSQNTGLQRPARQPKIARDPDGHAAQTIGPTDVARRRDVARKQFEKEQMKSRAQLLALERRIAARAKTEEVRQTFGKPYPCPLPQAETDRYKFSTALGDDGGATKRIMVMKRPIDHPVELQRQVALQQDDRPTAAGSKEIDHSSEKKNVQGKAKNYSKKNKAKYAEASITHVSGEGKVSCKAPAGNSRTQKMKGCSSSISIPTSSISGKPAQSQEMTSGYKKPHAKRDEVSDPAREAEPKTLVQQKQPRRRRKKQPKNHTNASSSVNA